jgi:hypothetical protein
MPKKEDQLKPIAVRVYPDARGDASTGCSAKPWESPDAMFVFDTETRTDETQRLTFGSYRFMVSDCCLEEGLFYADDLPSAELEILKRYTETYAPATAANGHPKLRLLSRAEFVDRLYRAAYKGRCLLVGFNLSFDLSRVAYDFTTARGRFAGGFALELWSYLDDGGTRHHNPHRPRIAIKHIDNKRAWKEFTGCYNPDRVDLIPDGSTTGEPEPGFRFRGHILDLRTLAFALTDRGYTLQSACEAFGVKHGKQHAARHGEITMEYIDYNRRDVLATSELAVKLLEEYDRHPIALRPTKAYSPASIGKACLRAMGAGPILKRQPNFPKEYLGYAESAFFGGRTSAHIRKTPVPVVYLDFLSMYPTVNALMDLWRFVIADEIKVTEHCQSQVIQFLTELRPDDLFKPAMWKSLGGFVKVNPCGDILPCRAKFSTESNDWQVAINYLHGETDNSEDGLWFTLPDVVASVLLTGKVPRIVDAFRIEARGTLPGLKPIRLRGEVEVDPRNQDFFRVAIEERKRLGSRKEVSESERNRLDRALKILSNATGYGIYAEMNRRESDEAVDLLCHGIDSEPFKCRVAHPDIPGEYCFPPLASLITGGARLMLSLLERRVTDLGGTYAMEDTDSMAIVATARGGIVSCPGGPRRGKAGQAGVRALTWKQVDEIVERFATLNPYSRDAVPGSILKIEDDNFDPTTRKQRQLYCYAISAKRYALYLKDAAGRPVLLRKGINNHDDRWSEHGLGHLLNPTDPESDDREWIAQIWLDMISRAEGILVPELSFENQPAVGRISVTSPALMRPLAALNDGRIYADKIKPFNFLVTCHVKAFGHPSGADPEHFHLIAPYQADPRQWLKIKWIDQYSGKRYSITTDTDHGSRKAARVKMYGEVAREYEFHPESKCADADGNVCEKSTVGLLQRRHVHIDLVKYIGKESNSLEDVEAGLIHSEHGVYTEYPDPRRDEWTLKILPALKDARLTDLIRETGMSKRALQDLRAGRNRPHPKNLAVVVRMLRKLGLI